MNAGSYPNENLGCGVILWYIPVALIKGYCAPTLTHGYLWPSHYLGSYVSGDPGCGVILWYILVALIEGYQNLVRLWLCTRFNNLPSPPPCL